MEKRIEMIDALRGLSVVFMIFHHLVYDMCEFLGAPWMLFHNPPLDLIHYVFAALFILLSGVSSRFSRSNIKRGVKVLLIAFGIYLVTLFMDMPIRFGVLHLLGFCMVFYGLTHKAWDSVPDIIMPPLCAVLLVGSALTVHFIKIDTKLLWMFGWTYPGFYSADYFPIFPWLFVFLLGTWLGKLIRENRFPKRFYEATVPFLPAVGRRSLLIYILHQPVLYGIVTAIRFITEK